MTTINETPTLAQVIKDAMEGRICNIHTAMPGRIVSYDYMNQTATIQLELQRKFRNGESVEIPPIEKVPVCMPRAGNSFLSLPLTAGDQVLVVFSERSIDEWKTTGGTVDPSSEARKHDFTDAFAIVGGYPESNPIEMDDENVLLVNDQARITLSSDGKFKFELEDGDEVLDLVFKALDTLSTTTTNTIFGPMKLNDFSVFADLRDRLDSLILRE